MKNFKEFLSEKLLLQYNNSLNPALWTRDNELKNDVRDKLLAIANAWATFSNISLGQIRDIIFTGSNANYNWIPNYSDIDVHLIVDFDNVVPGMSSENAQDYLYDKKVLWAGRHPNIRVNTYPVELYAQSYQEYLDYIRNTSAQRGVYSLTNNKWLSKPSFNRPAIFNDSNKIMSKVAYRRKVIDHLIDTKSYEKLKQFKNRLIASRGQGLANSGEFHILNMVYKELRNEGYLDKINKALGDLEDSQYSL